MRIVRHFMVLLAFCGIGLIVKGVRESRLAISADLEPTRMTCAELYDRKPGDNAYVTIRDYQILHDVFCAEASEDDPRWTRYWAPLIPFKEVIDDRRDGLDTELSSPPDDDWQSVRVLFLSRHFEDEGDVRYFDSPASLEGLIINESEEIDEETQQQLAEIYPGLDITTCWFFEEGRRPLSTLDIRGYFSGGAAMLVFSVLGYLAARWWSDDAGFLDED